MQAYRDHIQIAELIIRRLSIEMMNHIPDRKLLSIETRISIENLSPGVSIAVQSAYIPSLGSIMHPKNIAELAYGVFS
jgi:hypothetical protein